MNNKPRSSRTIIIVLSVVVVVVALLIVCAIVAFNVLKNYGDRITAEQESTLDMQEQLDDFRLQEQLSVEKNTYREDGFYEINGIRYYYAAGCEGIAGVDVSSYQNEIDWKAVEKAGIDFAIVRVGYRGWSSGNLDVDDYFHANVKGALEAGLDVGVYFFSQALTVEEAVEEAQYTLDLIKEYDIQGPVVFDWEEVEAEDARTNEMNMLLLTSCAEAFCREIENAGYNAGVYFNQQYGYHQLNLSSLDSFDFWLAEYNDTPTFEYDFQMWQYTNEGKVPGIEGNVDLNILFRSN